MQQSGLHVLARIIVGLVCLSGLVLAQPARASGTWYVSAEGSDANDCLTPATPCRNVQTVLDRANFTAGDTILVSYASYYTENDPMILIEKDATLSGGWTEDFSGRTHASIFDGNYRSSGIHVAEGVTATVEQVVIVNTAGKWAVPHDKYHGAERLDTIAFPIREHGLAFSLLAGSARQRAITMAEGYFRHTMMTQPSLGGSLGQRRAGSEYAGIYNKGTLTLTEVHVAGTAEGCGIDNLGTLTMVRSAINSTSENGSCNRGTLTMEESVIYNNFGSCGGLTNRGTLTMRRSTLYFNIAEGGYAGGMCNSGEALLLDSTIAGNFTIFFDRRAPTGVNWAGGIRNTGTLSLVNSTVVGNWAEGTGGGIYNEGTLTLRNATLWTNGSQEGAGGLDNRGTAHIQNSILAGNIQGDAATPADCAGTIVSEGYNLLADPTGCDWTAGAGDLLHVAPAFLPGAWTADSPYPRGSQLYYPLPPFSPAVDAGNPAGCTDAEGVALVTDQIGRPRPVDGNGDGLKRCDLGSYEYDPAADTNSYSWLPIVGR